MKKIIPIALCICMLLSMSTMAFAAELTAPGSSNTTVTYGVDTSYVVTVPDALTLDDAESTTCNIAVTNAILPSGSTLNVYMDAEDDAWLLKNQADETDTLQYAVSKNGAAVNSGSIVLSLAAGTTSANTTLTLNMVETPEKAGQYTDHITFTVSMQQDVEGAFNPGMYAFTITESTETLDEVALHLSDEEYMDIVDRVEAMDMTLFDEYGFQIAPIKLPSILGDASMVGFSVPFLLEGESEPMVLVVALMDGEYMFQVSEADVLMVNMGAFGLAAPITDPESSQYKFMESYYSTRLSAQPVDTYFVTIMDPEDVNNMLPAQVEAGQTWQDYIDTYGKHQFMSFKIYQNWDGYIVTTNVAGTEIHAYLTLNGERVKAEDAIVVDGMYMLEEALYTVTIDGVEYQCPHTCNWEEWVASEYNTGNFTIDGNRILCNGKVLAETDSPEGYWVDPLHSVDFDIEYELRVE